MYATFLNTIHLEKKSFEILKQQTDNSKSILVLTPIFGIIAFIILYIIATLLYPVGSQINKNSAGFSWTNNYWCNLLYDNAINGQHNPAKPVAMTGMFILCMSLSFFWFLFPRHINVSKKLKYAIPIFGTLSMVIAFSLFTDFNHDFIINLASIFGLVAIVGAFAGLYKTKRFGLFAFGLLNILLVGLNNYVYYTKGLIVYLPVVQKITFAAFLFWVCCINLNLYRKQGKTATSK